jgi:hypothetical protein
MVRRGEQRVPRATLHHPPAVEHVHLVTQPGDHTQIVGDHHECGRGVMYQLSEQGQDLRLDRDVQRGGRLVRDEQPWPARERHRDQRALPHPAGELVGVLVEPPPRVRDADPGEQPGGVDHRPLAGQAAVTLQHLADLQPDRHDGVERGQRVLEHHREVAAAALAHRGVGQPEQLRTLEAHRAADPHAPSRQQSHDRERGHGLAAAGLADQPDGLPRFDGEAHCVDGRGRLLALVLEGDGEVLDLQQGPGGGGASWEGAHGRLLLLGSRASRSDSPTRVKPSATTMIAPAGQNASCG